MRVVTAPKLVVTCTTLTPSIAKREKGTYIYACYFLSFNLNRPFSPWISFTHRESEFITALASPDLDYDGGFSPSGCC